MLKDPLDQSESPYELLGLAVDVPVRDVHASLARFMRDPRNRARVPQAQDAIKRLKSAATRASIDILMYDFEFGAAASPVDAEPQDWLAAWRAVPEIDVRTLPTDLDAAGLALCIEGVVARPMPLEDLRHFDDLSAALAPRFDR